MRLAQRLGAQSVTLPGRDIAQSILEYARMNNVTQIVIGKSERARWFEILHGSVVRDLMRESGDISVTAVYAHGDVVAPKSVKTVSRDETFLWRHYLWSALAVAVTVVTAVTCVPPVAAVNQPAKV